MKKTFAIIMTLMLLLSMTPAFALSWVDVEAEKCEEYTLTATKYIRVEGDVGAHYEKAPNATAKIGDTVYFDLAAVDTNGMEVEVDIEYHNLGDVEELDGLYMGKVVGNKPYVKIAITEKTPIDELFYKSQNIIVESNEVIIGNLVFMRDDNGKVRDVYHYGNYAEMIDDLFELGIDVSDIYDGKINMTDDILISNFGKVCNTEAVAAWYIAVDNDILGIPKTGDYTATGLILLALVALAVLCLWNTAKRARR